jgi:hypothetical protein
MARVYAVLAMVIGGAFYGYIIGTVTSVICETDANKRVYYERMDLIQSWLDHKDNVPKMLRRRIRKHFKQALSARTAMEDSDVVAQLSPELRDDTVFFIMDDHVRTTAMFKQIPNSALATILRILHKNHNKSEECIVKEGDPGIAMYILVEGTARYTKGSKWMPEEVLASKRKTQPKSPELTPGSSFGEEILFGFQERYTYTVVSKSDCDFHIISEDDFTHHFRNLPDLRDHMLANFMRSKGVKIQTEGEKVDLEPEPVRRCSGKPSLN